MTDFIWPSDLDRAENDELNRVCEYLEEVLDEHEALAAQVERWHSVYVDLTNSTMMFDDVVHYVANNAMMRRFDEIDESTPTISLARRDTLTRRDEVESLLSVLGAYPDRAAVLGMLRERSEELRHQAHGEKL